MSDAYIWKVTKSGPRYGLILLTKESSSLFPTPEGEKKTKRSKDFTLEYNGQEYTVFQEQVGTSNFRLWGRDGDLRQLYQDLGIITSEGEKINGTIQIQKQDGKYSLTYDASTEHKEAEDLPEEDKFGQLLTQGQIGFVTFHPSYSYEDFVEGFRPDTNGGFKVHDGIFKQICLRALQGLLAELREEDKEVPELASWEEFGAARAGISRLLAKKLSAGWKIPAGINHVLIIDEINRGDISKILGELITLMEEDKRLGATNELSATLPYSNHTFCVPPNLYLIGTMNTADRSLALMDVALRRRFAFQAMMPKFDELKADPAAFNSKSSEFFIKSIVALEQLNTALSGNDDIGKDKQIGHAYLCNIVDEGSIVTAWLQKILPLLEEYYYFDKVQLEELVGTTFYTRSSGWKVTAENLSGLLDKLSGSVEQ